MSTNKSLKTPLSIAIAVAATIASSSVFADDHSWPEKYTSIGIEGNYNVAAEGAEEERNDNLENYAEGGISVHHRFNPKYSVRLQYGVAEGDTTTTDVAVDIDRLQLGGRLHAAEKENSKWRPFAGAGVDYVEYTVDDRNFKTDEIAVYGEVGLQRLLNSRTLFEVGTRVRAEVDDIYIDAQPFIGLQFLMGREYAAPVVAPTPVAPMDSDADGVVDPMDQCPGTEVDVLVDEKGCPQMLTETIQKSLYVDFDTNRTVVKQSSYPAIAEFAQYLKQYVNSELVLEGHTDSRGSADYNMRLSEGRAAAVKRVLIEEYGIAPNRIDTLGLGETQPIADNATSEGRAKNRRVEAILSASKTEVIRK